MVLNPESPPISPKTTRDGKSYQQQQQSSHDDLSVEDLSSDNIGYDADIEVVRPDYIEEADSESENDPSAGLSRGGIKCLLWSPPPPPPDDTDDELASKMRKLSWHRPKHFSQLESGHSSSSGGGSIMRGPMYEPMHQAQAHSHIHAHAHANAPLPSNNLSRVINTHGKRSEFDVEMVDGNEASSPSFKRRKRRDDRSGSGIIQSQAGAGGPHMTDTDDAADDDDAAAAAAVRQASKRAPKSTGTQVGHDQSAVAESNEMDLD